MNFTQILFLPFLLITFLAWLPWRVTGRKVVLVIASIVFYGAWDLRFLGLLLVVWLIVLFIPPIIARTQERKSRFWRTVGVTSLLLLLFWFKYYDFFIESTGLGQANGALRILLPVGISFYTFQAISYILDVYRGKVQANRSPLDTALYVSFFPLLLAGPIEKGSHWMPQVAAFHPFQIQNLRDAFERMLLGYVLKVGIADSLAPLCNDVFARAATASSGELWAGSLGYTMQILADFAGYSLIARGVAKMFGYEIIRNFEQPYFSQSFSEFWRRWHISLSTWIWSYLFYPLISIVLRLVRHLNLSSVKQEMNIAYPIATLGTMLLCGIWHGAGYTYAVWGLLHGTFLIVERLVVYRGKPIRKRRRTHNVAGLLNAVLATFIVFLLVSFAWIVFRSASLSDAWTFIIRMFTAGGWVVQKKLLVQLVVGLVSILVIEISCYTRRDEWFFRRAGHWRGLAYAGAVIYLIVFGGTSGNIPFIYFQF